MMKKENLSTVALAALVLSHVVLFFTVGDPVATFLPALVAGAATTFFTHRHSPEPKIRPRPKAMVLALAFLVAATLASFHFAGSEVSLKLHLARALLADCTLMMMGSSVVFLKRRLACMSRQPG